MNPLLISLLPLIGAVIGGTLQYFFSRSTEIGKQLYTLKNQAYVDYLRAVAQAAHAQIADDRIKALLLASDAKSRIVVYGDPVVIQALAEFERLGPRLDQDPSLEAFIRLAATMRTKGTKVALASIELLLIGTRRKREANSSPHLTAPSRIKLIEPDPLLPRNADPSTSIDGSRQDTEATNVK